MPRKIYDATASAVDKMFEPRPEPQGVEEIVEPGDLDGVLAELQALRMRKQKVLDEVLKCKASDRDVLALLRLKKDMLESEEASLYKRLTALHKKQVDALGEALAVRLEIVAFGETVAEGEVGDG
jgi:hypothetical protein